MIQKLLSLSLLGTLSALPGLQEGGARVFPEDASASWDGSSRVVHEWGTFTSVRSSRGETLTGLRHDERDLPEFVHDVSDYAALAGAHSPKMETPVIYFYSPERWRVQVDVAFPRGLVTRWFPAASEVNLAVAERTEQLPVLSPRAELEAGYVRWGTDRELTVLGPEDEAIPEPVEDGDPWRFTRDVHANWLEVCNRNQAREFGLEVTAEDAHVYERFLFYRGLGAFELPLTARAVSERLEGERCRVELVLENERPAEVLRHLFLIRVRDGRCGWTRLADVEGALRTGPVDLELGDLARSTEELVGALTDSLASTGLFLDEAYSMARTWQHGYFQEEGLRLLYVLPRASVDEELPLEVSGRGGAPGPDSIVRTFVARVELLSPEQERELESVVHDFAHGRGVVAADAREELVRWGRFQAPYLEAVARSSADARVVRVARGLIAESGESGALLR